MGLSFSRFGAVFLLTTTVASLGACKEKTKKEGSFVPLPRRAAGVSELQSVCETGKPIPGNDAYSKRSTPTSPNKVAVFRKYLDEKSPQYRPDEHEFGAIDGKSGPAGVIELVACVTLKRSGDSMVCSYMGARIDLFNMTHTVKVMEVATGKVLSEQTFDLDPRTEKCAASTTGSSFRGTNYAPKVLSLLLPFEPDGVELPKIEPYDLDSVCSGSAFPQAAAYVPTGPHPIHVVYFPTATRSFTRADLPAGLEQASALKTPVRDVQLVACVTGVPQQKVMSCKFAGGKVLELSSGDFQVEVREARSGKVVEKKTFPGTSAGCPASYAFFNNVDKVMTKVSPTFGAYIKQLSGG